MKEFIRNSKNGKDILNDEEDLEEIVIVKGKRKEHHQSLEEEIFGQLDRYFLEEETTDQIPRDYSSFGINNDNITRAHNGKIISDINYDPNIKYLVTNSMADESIIGWFVNADSERI